MLALVTVSVFLSVILLVYGVSYALQGKILVKQRLHYYGTKTAHATPAQDGSLYERLLRPLVQQTAQFASSRTPQKSKDRLRQQLIMAGSPGGLQAAEFMAVKILLAFGGFAAGILLPIPILYGIIFPIVLYIFPDFYLRRRVAQRQKEIALAVPDMLDLLTVSVEAGLGFDSAIAKVVEKSQGALAEEFQRMLQEIRIGRPRREALRSLSQRTGVDYLQELVAAIIQADQLGVSIGRVLRIQSTEIRRKRRQRAEEEAMKAPIKMLFPLVLFVFPSLFIVLLGPALMRFMDAF